MSKTTPPTEGAEIIDEAPNTLEPDPTPTPQAEANDNAGTPATDEGTITLTASTRDELFEQVAALKAAHPAKTVCVGAAGRKDDGTFVILATINTEEL